MNWSNWASSLDQIWRSPTFPTWLTLAAAAFFGIVVLVTLLRAEKSVANGALTVITLLSIAVAVAATIRGFTPGGQGASAELRTAQATGQTVAALACVDDLAGDAVLNACEKVLFGSADTAAAAVSYAASQISRLTAFGDLATAERNSTTELQALRRAIEHDRYGLMAYVLMARDRCTPTACPAFRSLGDNHQVIANMNERTYENLITRYTASWNAPATQPSAAGLVAALPPSMPTGKPTNAEFPSASSTPPVSIMTPEPARPSAAAAPAPAARAPGPPPAVAAAKRPPAPKRPVQIAPPPPAAPAAAVPAASAPAAASEE
ncbi:hypothetical protein J6500_12335 [Bradyrhizobium sp. WSM 1704]|uniref:hypothetical protein n=1 Tax=Bradyrhizobium semiaridum TaxID=2821404 RepID=UPI001CE32E1C|nr:hypothetical protein [Bradyrhizobium semiaridum]MCA6122676.1 hypothetical protein [Bradyrhizobium semiaridum]